MELMNAESAREFVKAWAGRPGEHIHVEMAIEGMRRCESIYRSYSKVEAASVYAGARAVLEERLAELKKS